MAGRDELQREIGRLAGKLEGGGSARVIDELSAVREGLASEPERTPAVELADLRLGFACKQRWEDMVGDERVRACSGCDRPVFNLSAMTREEAEAVLATRGLTPCVRFYRRPDGTVMTTDCPMGTRREGRRLAVFASTLAAGTALAGVSPAVADPPPANTASQVTSAPEAISDPSVPAPTPADPAAAKPVVIDHDVIMGIPLPPAEMGIIAVTPDAQPRLAWSIWGRFGVGVASHPPDAVARRVDPPMAESSATWEAALAADLSLRVAAGGRVRLGAWGELRTSSEPVAGGELVVGGLPPHPYLGRFDGSGSLVLRAGGNAHVVTAALGFGYVGSWHRDHPWVRWMGYVVGSRIVVSMNRSLDDPRDWSAMVGLEVEPIGAVRYVLRHAFE